MKINKEIIYNFLKLYDDLVDMALDILTKDNAQDRDAFDEAVIEDDCIVITYSVDAHDPKCFYVMFDDIIEYSNENK